MTPKALALILAAFCVLAFTSYLSVVHVPEGCALERLDALFHKLNCNKGTLHATDQ